MRRARAFALAAMVLAAALLIVLKIGGGAVSITWAELARWLTGGEIAAVKADILGSIRLPRALMALVAGAVLAVSGVVYQALLRNPLAEPYTLGVSGGATLGAVSAIILSSRLGLNTMLQGAPIVQTAALAGALLTVVFIQALASRWGLQSSGFLVLCGVAMNLFFSSIILLMQYVANYAQIHAMLRWMMGGLDVVGYSGFIWIAPAASFGLAASVWYARALDPLSVDPVTAAALGVHVKRVRRILMLAASLMTGAVVAVCGPIGFVGLIVPHCVRMAGGAGHQRVVPWSALAGAIFLLACDTAAQNIVRGVEIPVGVFTAMLGGPFFVFLLMSRSRSAGLWMN